MSRIPATGRRTSSSAITGSASWPPRLRSRRSRRRPRRRPPPESSSPSRPSLWPPPPCCWLLCWPSPPPPPPPPRLRLRRLRWRSRPCPGRFPSRLSEVAEVFFWGVLDVFVTLLAEVDESAPSTDRDWSPDSSPRLRDER